MVPFVYLASVCRSLQCPISALTQAGRGGLLFRFTCPVVLWGGGTLQTNVTGLCGEHQQCSGHTGFAPAHGVGASPSTLLRLQAALQGAGPEFPALPRAKPLRFRFLGPPQRRRLRWACVLCLPSPSSSGSQELDGHTPPGCRAPSPLHGPSLSFPARRLGAPCVPSGKLISGCDPPGGCRPSRISGSLWLETGSLFAVW